MWSRIALILAAAAFLFGCVSEGEKIDATNAVNVDFQKAYEEILDEIGTRFYPVSVERAITAMDDALAEMGMHTIISDTSTGLLQTSAPAPTPLTLDEWHQIADTDEPRLKNIIRPYIGSIPTMFIGFEPEGLNILIRVTAIENGNGVDVSLTMRMEETAPPKSGYPRRTYAPPSAVRMGLGKIWTQFERELTRR